MRRFLTALAFLLACGLLNGCREPLYQNQGYVFGTLVDISIYGESEQRAHELTDHVLADFQSLHHRLHAWQKDSDLSRINQAFSESNKPIPISAELAHIIRDASALSVQSGGLFNPAIGGLIQQWGFQRDEFSAVKIDDPAIAKLIKAKPQMTDIVLSGNTAYSTNPAVKLDLGGYAKGYALDRASAYLRNQGVKNALVNIGGNIIAIGKHGDRAWRVGIQHPRHSGAIATLALEDGWAIGTSGDYQRYFELGGKRFCHIIDPRTGYPAQGTQAVTILVPPGLNAGTLSDVASKPIFISSPAQRKTAAQAMNIDEFLVIDGQGKIFASPGMRKRLQWVEKNVVPAIF
ncbi:MAG TPA: FAD:protein FMN transferase [Methylophilaceae bacterium]|nr:FAD:protein FMN transferase [Methylophilaceae bacterium]